MRGKAMPPEELARRQAERNPLTIEGVRQRVNDRDGRKYDIGIRYALFGDD